MEAKAKNKLTVFLFILVIFAAVSWYNTRNSLLRVKTAAADKAALSMELEEKNIKLEKERAALSEDLRKLKIRLDQEKTSHEEAKKTLSQELIAGQALKAELGRLHGQKDKAEKQLREILSEQEKTEVSQ